jgi:hypothetical protein
MEFHECFVSSEDEMTGCLWEIILIQISFSLSDEISCQEQMCLLMWLPSSYLLLRICFLLLFLILFPSTCLSQTSGSTALAPKSFPRIDRVLAKTSCTSLPQGIDRETATGINENYNVKEHVQCFVCDTPIIYLHLFRTKVRARTRSKKRSNAREKELHDSMPVKVDGHLQYHLEAFLRVSLFLKTQDLTKFPPKNNAAVEAVDTGDPPPSACMMYPRLPRRQRASPETWRGPF